MNRTEFLQLKELLKTCEEWAAHEIAQTKTHLKTYSEDDEAQDYLHNTSTIRYRSKSLFHILEAFDAENDEVFDDEVIHNPELSPLHEKALAGLRGNHDLVVKLSQEGDRHFGHQEYVNERVAMGVIQVEITEFWTLQEYAEWCSENNLTAALRSSLNAFKMEIFPVKFSEWVSIDEYEDVGEEYKAYLKDMRLRWDQEDCRVNIQYMSKVVKGEATVSTLSGVPFDKPFSDIHAYDIESKLSSMGQDYESIIGWVEWKP